MTFYRNRDLTFRKLFSRENDLVYCNDVKGLIDEFKSISYNADDWRLFIDSSTWSLKAVLFHNGNVYAPIPVAHSVTLMEEYQNLDFLLAKLKYNNHNWKLCGNLKIMTILLGQQRVSRNTRVLFANGIAVLVISIMSEKIGRSDRI